MPVYNYLCKKCGDSFEIEQKINDEPFKLHKEIEKTTCRGSVARQIFSPIIKFNGTGFYETDYKNKTDKDVKKPIDNIKLT